MKCIQSIYTVYLSCKSFALSFISLKTINKTITLKQKYDNTAIFQEVTNPKSIGGDGKAINLGKGLRGHV